MTNGGSVVSPDVFIPVPPLFRGQICGGGKSERDYGIEIMKIVSKLISILLTSLSYSSIPKERNMKILNFSAAMSQDKESLAVKNRPNILCFPKLR